MAPRPELADPLLRPFPPRKPARQRRGLDRVWLCLACYVLVSLVAGCHSKGTFKFDPAAPYEQVATSIAYPDSTTTPDSRLEETPSPYTVGRGGQPEAWEMTLDEAIQIALSTSPVIRDAGGRVVRAPETVPTAYDPAVVETDPRIGPEAALSVFDAQFVTGILWQKNDRAVNNLLLGGLSGLTSTGFQQDYGSFQAEISKTAATGTSFSLENTIDYDFNNRLFNLLPSSYDAVVTAEMRHPLLQGGGIDYNRIAGPRATPGNYNGVVLARINTDISLADLEAAVRDLLLDVERTYWQLYFAYRNLEAKTAARDSALETWRLVHRKYELGEADGEQESLARQQYYLFQLAVVDALGGREAGPGIPGGGGVYSTERRLRVLLGLPACDGRLIRPAEEPSTVQTLFDWRTSVEEALCRRVELRRQDWLVKRRELELVAGRNFLQMRLDLLGQYRWRGLGGPLLGEDSAFAQLLDGDYQEWQLGLQLTTPVGNRIGHAAVRNAELLLAREKARFSELERQIVNETAGAFAELDRDFAAARLTYNRADATRQQFIDVRKKYLGGWSPLQFLLDAQARAADADTEHYRALVDYAQAIAEMHRAKGTLLDYYQVCLAEGPWSSQAYLSAKKQARRFAPKLLNYSFTCPPPVSDGVPVSSAAGPPSDDPFLPEREADESEPSSESLLELVPLPPPAIP